MALLELSYNLPGYGFANCNVYAQAKDLMDLLEGGSIIEKLKNTCQLGTMKYVYPGAHHTRYEYLFTQLMLIYSINVTNKPRNIEIAMSSNLNEYQSAGFKVSGAVLMQCLAILSNAGHMYDTFTSSRILLRLLKESKKSKTKLYQIYKRNLPSNIRSQFDCYLEQGNYYKLHLFHIIHILKGMSKSDKNKKLCDLCIMIISQLIVPELIRNDSTQRVFYLYKKIRKIAYLSVDMVYIHQPRLEQT